MNIKSRASKVYAKANDRPYTYISKNDNKAKNLRANMRTKHMESGFKSLKYSAAKKIVLKNMQICQVPERVYETVRLLFLTKLNKAFPKIDKKDYLFRLDKYPHQILRLKAAASAQTGISVDRISTGMKNAFGKPYSMAAKLRYIDRSVIEVYLSEKYADDKSVDKIKEILKKLNHKLPFKSKIEVVQPDHNLKELKIQPVDQGFKP